MRHRPERRRPKHQADLFDPPRRRPRWPALPHETRQTVTALLARLLGDPPVPPRAEVEHD